MKQLISKLLSYFGYAITKVDPRSFVKKDKKVKVGNFIIVMPWFNPLIYTYKKKTDFASEIGRIVESIAEFHTDAVAIDVGANTGDTVATIRSFADIPILSIEGDDTSFAYLTKNLAQFNHVTAIKQFLGEKDGKLNVIVEKTGWNTTLIPTENNYNETKTIHIKTLDTVLKEHNIPRHSVKFIKIDTEGFDTVILRGAWETINISKPVVLLEYNCDNMLQIKEDGLNTLLNFKNLGYEKILFFDDIGRFMLATDFSDIALIEHLHRYISLKNGLVYYYNICLFHETDNNLALKCINAESRYLESQIKNDQRI